MPQLLRSAVVACALFLALPALALAGVQPGQPFPTNLDTKIDLTQLTGLRVALPKPNCTTNPSDCCGHRRAEHARRLQRRCPRLDSVQRADRPHHGHARHGLPRQFARQRTPLDRLVWTAATNTLHGVPHTYLTSTRRTCSS